MYMKQEKPREIIECGRIEMKRTLCRLQSIVNSLVQSLIFSYQAIIRTKLVKFYNLVFFHRWMI